MKTKRLIIIGTIGVGVLLLLGASALLVRGVMRLRAENESLADVRRTLNTVYDRDPFPSKENIAKERANTERLDQWFGFIYTRLAKSNVTSSENSPSLFVNRFDKVKRKLRDQAEKQGAGVTGAEDFAFGFAAYSGTGLLPERRHVTTLSEQLTIVETISQMLFDSGIKQLEGVSRDIFEHGIQAKNASSRPGTPGNVGPAASGRGASRSPRRPASRRRASSGAKAKEKAKGKAIEVGPLFTKQHFQFQFQASEHALIEVLNRLRAGNLFVVITSVRFEKSLPDLVPEPAVPATGQPTVGVPLFGGVTTEEPEETVIPPWKRPKEDRVVSGMAHEKPMRVTLDLDVYKFEEE